MENKEKTEMSPRRDTMKDTEMFPLDILMVIASHLPTQSCRPPVVGLGSHRQSRSTNWPHQSPFTSDALAYALADPMNAQAVAEKLSFKLADVEDCEEQQLHKAIYGLYICPDLIPATDTDTGEACRLKSWKSWLHVLSTHVTHFALREPQTDKQVKIFNSNIDMSSSLFARRMDYSKTWYSHFKDVYKFQHVTPRDVLGALKCMSEAHLPVLRDLDLVVWFPSQEPDYDEREVYLEPMPVCYREAWKLDKTFMNAATKLLVSVGPQLERLRLPADDQLIATLRAYQLEHGPLELPQLHTLAVVHDKSCNGQSVLYGDFVRLLVRCIPPGNRSDVKVDDRQCVCSPLKELSLSNVDERGLDSLAFADDIKHIRQSVTKLSLSILECEGSGADLNDYKAEMERKVARLVGSFPELKTFQWTGSPSTTLMDLVLAQASTSLSNISISCTFEEPWTCTWVHGAIWNNGEVVSDYIVHKSMQHNEKLETMMAQAGERLYSVTAVSNARRTVPTQFCPVLGVRCLELEPSLTKICRSLKSVDIEIDTTTVSGLAKMIECNEGMRSVVVRVHNRGELYGRRLLGFQGWEELGNSISTRKCLHTVDIATFAWEKGHDWSWPLWHGTHVAPAMVGFVFNVLENLESPLRVFRFCTRAALTKTFAELVSRTINILSILATTNKYNDHLTDFVLHCNAAFDEEVSTFDSVTGAYLRSIQQQVICLERTIWARCKNLDSLEVGPLKQILAQNLKVVEEEEYGAELWSKLNEDW